MDIPLPQPENPDIYSYGFDKGLNRGEPIESSVVYDANNTSESTFASSSGQYTNDWIWKLGSKRIVIQPGSNIQLAINDLNNAGGGIVILTKGIHIVNYDIILYSSISLEGEGIYNTIIDFNDNAKQIKIEGTTKTEAGTFDIDTGVDPFIVTGTGTAFTNASAGDFIGIVDGWYEIASIQSDTQLTLTEAYPVDITSGSVWICDIKQKIDIKNLTIQNSQFSTNYDGSGGNQANGNVYIKGARQIIFENIRSLTSDNTQALYPAWGCFMNGVSYTRFINSEFSLNHSDGIKGMGVSFISFEKCIFKQNGDAGMFLDVITGEDNFIVNCNFNDNSGSNGALRLANLGNAINIKILGNTLKNGNSIKIAGSVSKYLIIANNKIDGQISLAASHCSITGNYITNGVSNIGINVTSGRDNVVVGNTLEGCYISLGSNLIQIVNSNQTDYFYPSNNQKIVYLQNTSGGQLTIGNLVILKSTATGYEFTTTTTQGDDKVFGMIMETIANNAYGAVLVEGKTISLKVDGTTDIAIGDFIGTFTSAGIGMKAAAGDMAIAIALEAYATDDSNGVIDAYLITPRKI